MKLTVIFRNFANASKNVPTIKTGWQNVVCISADSDLETLNSNQPMEMSNLPAICRLFLCPDETNSRCLRNVRDYLPDYILSHFKI